MIQVIRVTAKQSKITVILVDDFVPWRARVREMLDHHSNWDIIGEAGDGSEAVEKAVQLQPDIVILDLSMPRMNGIEAARLIRQRSPATAIVFLSQHTDTHIKREALSVGHAYVLKSKAKADLLSAIEMAQAAATSDRESESSRN